MKTSNGRQHESTSLSLPPKFRVRVQTRVDALYPHVSSFSNYVVQLIMADMDRGILGPVVAGTKKGEKSPFEMGPWPPSNSNAAALA